MSGTYAMLVESMGEQASHSKHLQLQRDAHTQSAMDVTHR